MIQALFFDIDGTLVSFQTHRIPPSTLRAVHEVRQRGVKVFIATGRPLPFIDNLGELEYDGIMCVNGAYCITSQGQVICQHPVSRADVRRLVDYCQLHPMPVAFASLHNAILCGQESNPEAVREVFTLLNLPVPQPASFADALDMEDVMQVIAFFTASDEAYIMSHILQECDSNRWHPLFTDCIAKGTSKATGIDTICQYYDIPLAHTMAFGDGGNDIPMLRHAGIGVAMGNASPQVKAAADVVTASVDDDGIALILQSLPSLLS